jgi:hypothetical protein
MLENQQQKLFSNWKTIKYGVSQRSILESLLFMLEVNDSPPRPHSYSKPLLFVDTTRALTGNNLEALQWNLHLC